MWEWTLLAPIGMWVQKRTGGYGYVGTDVTAGRVLARMDVFPKMTMSQKLDFDYSMRFVSRVKKILILLSLLHMPITTFLCKTNYT